MFPYWTFIKYGVPLLIGIIIGSYGMNVFKNITINKLKVDNAAYEETYNKDKATIVSLTAEIKNSNDVCNKRLIEKDKIIKRIQQIEYLKPGEPNEVDYPNSIIGNLDGMWENSTD